MQEHNEKEALQEESRQHQLEYFTIWIHQIKTPIASLRLQLQQEQTSEALRELSDLNRIEQYVEMVLTYLRLQSDTTDYVIREYDLDDILKEAIRNFSGEFILRRIHLDYEPANGKVLTDRKWLLFVVEQVLSNALKYTNPGGSITLRLEEGPSFPAVTRALASPRRICPGFDSGFTGLNGRSDQRATGLGLSLCRSICRRLGHEITAASTLGEGTTIRICLARPRLFPE